MKILKQGNAEIWRTINTLHDDWIYRILLDMELWDPSTKRMIGSTDVMFIEKEDVIQKHDQNSGAILDCFPRNRIGGLQYGEIDRAEGLEYDQSKETLCKVEGILGKNLGKKQ